MGIQWPESGDDERGGGRNRYLKRGTYSGRKYRIYRKPVKYLLEKLYLMFPVVTGINSIKWTVQPPFPQKGPVHTTLSIASPAPKKHPTSGTIEYKISGAHPDDTFVRLTMEHDDVNFAKKVVVEFDFKACEDPAIDEGKATPARWEILLIVAPVWR
ncbi:hypothetical protein F5146DRAFT_1001554 [Armillaria mellea]|nr:hypothetical protein F5146DRAFT_1001554 [Armillaria mellea]